MEGLMNWGRSITRSLMAAAVAVPMIAGLAAATPAAAETTLRVVMHSDLKIVDPIWTTAYITRNHGYMIYDTLFAMDEKLNVTPQMVDSWKVSDDKVTYTFTRRDGLLWHDGQPVTAEDGNASTKRWGRQDPMGQKMQAFLSSETRRVGTGSTRTGRQS